MPADSYVVSVHIGLCDSRCRTKCYIWSFRKCSNEIVYNHDFSMKVEFCIKYAVYVKRYSHTQYCIHLKTHNRREPHIILSRPLLTLFVFCPLCTAKKWMSCSLLGAYTCVRFSKTGSHMATRLCIRSASCNNDINHSPWLCSEVV